MLPTKFQLIWESGFREDFFRNQPIKNKNGLWQPCLLMDRNPFFFLIGRFKKISSSETACPLKPLVQMNRNLVGSIYERSSIKIANFIPIC
jgi:hypothetical protein